MPIFIALKEPRINLIVAGEIKDDKATTREYDELFKDGVLMMTDREGQNIVVPLWKESNIAFMREISEEEIKENEELQKKMQEEAEKKGGGGGQLISRPGYTFPQGRGRGNRL